MKQIIYLCCILGLTACNSNKPKSAETYTQTPTGLQGIQQSATNANNSTSSQAQANPDAKNPAHGAPGHRCDIPVGAPLNTPATPSQTNTQQATPAVAGAPTVNTSPAATKANTTNTVPMFNEKGQKLNPEHGKPGHKCELPVGAPLT